MSPWVRELGITERLSKYSLCENCGTGYFSKRYDDVEMSKIYENYRGERYLNIRSSWEPWYSHAYNSNHDSPEWINSRKKSLTDFLLSQGLSKCKSIVDVGGDRGQYIPDIAERKIVFDISGKTTLDGVERISDFEQLPHSDLIVYAHVLEHVTHPIEELRRLLEKTNAVYVEVPYGVPVINNHRKSKIRLLIHLASSFNRRIWRRRTIPATGRKVSSIKMLTQSEHLTFFTEASMIMVAKSLGTRIEMKKSFISTPDLNKAEVLQCLLTAN